MNIELTEGQRRKVLTFAITERRQLNSQGKRTCAKTFERAEALINALSKTKKDK